jgi:CRISPR/Cas system CSM-associated protein Csm4 (group 5 of RAMP superfamily)
MEIKVTPNYSKRTFTIRKNYSDGQKVKYRTIQFNQDEFNSELMNTENDWKQFLKSNDYYRVR